MSARLCSSDYIILISAMKNKTTNWQLIQAHVEMMGLIGMGNNPMVGATVVVAASVAQALAK